MNSLIDKAYQNLNILNELKEDEVLTGNHFDISKQDEYVQPDNIRALETSLYFTFHQIYLSFNDTQFPPKKVYIMLDDSICNLYENKNFRTLMKNDKGLLELVEDIDTKLSVIGDINYFYSPIYPLLSGMSSLRHVLSFMFKNATYTLNQLHINKTCDETSEDESSDEEKSCECSKETKEEEKEEEKDAETCESNPNLVYEEEEEKDIKKSE